ncbi:MAG: 50S ribosome-binding GTPase [Gorillibacterium sp.]|nr:50S ribosome-binding GTPase [Gorillibacterium sp.]
MSTYRVALAGNPNTGKSTLFNMLTGLRQHTGNWAGKTVAKAESAYEHNGNSYLVVDLPGTYSLFSNSEDEEVARDYVILEKPDVTVVVVDATSLERHMNLVLQVLEMTTKVVICVNLMDEARKLGIAVDALLLSKKLGVPVVKISAMRKEGLPELIRMIEKVAKGTLMSTPVQIRYNEEIETKISVMVPEISSLLGDEFPARWIALRLLDGDDGILEKLIHRVKKSERRELNYLERTYCN